MIFAQHQEGKLLRILLCAAGCLAASPALASPTTTGEAGDVAHFLVNEAVCRDFTAAIDGIHDPGQSAERSLMVIVAVAYMAGLADGRGQSRDTVSELEIIRCLTQPDAPFAQR